MKAKILDINGKEKSQIDLPGCFSHQIREDLIQKVLEAKKSKQPYSPSPVAGKQHAAKGKVVHRRHVWRSGYGRGMARVPRKIMTRKGSQFNWVATEVPFARGGMRAHPPKIISMVGIKKINKKELESALCSALSATTNPKIVGKKYSTLEGKKIENFPIVLESKFVDLKTKNLLESMKKVLGKELFEIAVKKKSVRNGKGKARGRKYKSTAGMLFVIGEKEKLKSGSFEVVTAKEMGVTDLAKGGIGRLTAYTEDAIKYLGKKLK